MAGAQERKFAVIGGGVGGLAAAHRLYELADGPPLSVSVLEAANRCGGVIETIRKDGFLMESGPDSLITEKPWALQLMDRIGLDARVIGTEDSNRRSFVVRRGRLYPTPDGFHLMAPAKFLPLLTTPLLSPLGKLRVGLDLVIPPRRSSADETLGSFVIRRMGQEALDAIAQPMITAIYGADPKKLSLMATFPRFRDLELKYGSIVRAMWTSARKQAAAAKGKAGDGASGARYSLFASLDGGLQLLTDTLQERLPSGVIRTGIRVERILRTRGGRWSVQWDGGTEEFDGVVLALPAPRISEIVRSFDEQLARRLSFITYGSSATVSMGYRVADVSHAMNGFGFVVPSREGMSMLGCTFAHQKYADRAPEGHALLRAFHGDRTRVLGDDDLIEATRRDLGRLLGIQGEPLFTRVARYEQSLPHYGLGHLDLVTEIEKQMAEYRGLALAGNAFRGIGVPDCVRSGEAAAQTVLDELS
jgi:oxygen-dependent protoporphyrinogen oxidase